MDFYKMVLTHILRRLTEDVTVRRVSAGEHRRGTLRAPNCSSWKLSRNKL
jgi:hypothetical protein